MTQHLTRWYPIPLMRDALGRFMGLRIPRPCKPRRRTTAPPLGAVQLALF